MYPLGKDILRFQGVLCLHRSQMLMGSISYFGIFYSIRNYEAVAQMYSVKKVLYYFVIFTGKGLCWSLF